MEGSERTVLQQVMESFDQPDQPGFNELERQAGEEEYFQMFALALDEALEKRDPRGAAVMVSFLKTSLMRCSKELDMLMPRMELIRPILRRGLDRCMTEWGGHGEHGQDEMFGLLLIDAFGATALGSDAQKTLFEAITGSEELGIRFLLRSARHWLRSEEVSPLIRGALQALADSVAESLEFQLHGEIPRFEFPAAMLLAVWDFVPEGANRYLLNGLLHQGVEAMEEMAALASMLELVVHEVGEDQAELSKVVTVALALVQSVDQAPEGGAVLVQLLRVLVATFEQLEEGGADPCAQIDKGAAVQWLLMLHEADQERVHAMWEAIRAARTGDGDPEAVLGASSRIFEMGELLGYWFRKCETIAREVEGAGNALASVAGQYIGVIRNAAAGVAAAKSGQKPTGEPQYQGWWLDELPPMAIPLEYWWCFGY